MIAETKTKDKFTSLRTNNKRNDYRRHVDQPLQGRVRWRAAESPAQRNPVADELQPALHKEAGSSERPNARSVRERAHDTSATAPRDVHEPDDAADSAGGKEPPLPPTTGPAELVRLRQHTARATQEDELSVHDRFVRLCVHLLIVPAVQEWRRGRWLRRWQFLQIE